jgi:hypothetical protein
MCQNLMILARMGDLRTRPALGAFPPLVLRCSSGLSRRRVLQGTKSVLPGTATL